MKKRFIRILTPSILLSLLFFSACRKDPSVSLVKTWTIPLSARNEVPAPAGHNETGVAALQLLSDNSLSYVITVQGLSEGDVLNAAHLHVGNVITSGPVILPFNPVFVGGVAAGVIPNLRQTLVDSLKNDANEIYFNAHSTNVPSGIVRGQLNTGVALAADVTMIGANEVPPVATTATGLALVRMTTGKQLYSKVTVSNLEPNDTMKLAHYHVGAVGVNGPVYVGFYTSAADFGTVKVTTVADSVYTTLLTKPIYVNAHSVKHPGGIIRGQIR